MSGALRQRKAKLPSLKDRLKQDLHALLLMLFAIFLAVACLNYQLNPHKNLGGWLGYQLARATVGVFGWSAQLLPIALLYVASRIFLGMRGWLLARSFFGVLCLVAGGSLLLATLTQGTNSTSAGYLGQWLFPYLQNSVGQVGIWLSCGLLAAISTLLLWEIPLRKQVELLFTAVKHSVLWVTMRLPRLFKKLTVSLQKRWRQRQVAYAIPKAPIITEPSKPKEITRDRIKLAEARAVVSETLRDDSEAVVASPALPAEKLVFQTPSLELMQPAKRENSREWDKAQLIDNARLLERKLSDFGVQGKVTEVQPGPVITLYEYAPAAGIKVNKIAQLADDLALALSALSVRIIAPIPGKAVVGIEISNTERETVYFSEICASKDYTTAASPLSLALGKDISGAPVVADLQSMPHLLVAGATGAGKSVSVNTMILSILYRATPEQVKFLMIDPKMLELSLYDHIPHLLHPVIVQPRKAARALQWVVAEMERRYALMADLGVRNLESYNQRADQAKSELGPDGQPLKHLPYVVVVIDELADLMIVCGREVEEGLTRLAQMARASGIHLIVATQRPSVDVITGTIKANFPSRISFKVASKTDSRTILDSNGAEKLLGRGDMLFIGPGTNGIKRIHGGYVSEAEVKKVTDFIRTQGKPDYALQIKESDEGEANSDDPVDDELYRQARSIVLQSRNASISLVQRRLRIGYNRAARMIERMEHEGLVSRAEPGKPRSVLASAEL